MEKIKGKVKLNDELLDQVSGGNELFDDMKEYYCNPGPDGCCGCGFSFKSPTRPSCCICCGQSKYLVER